MKSTKLKYILILPALVLALSSCYKMRVEVHNIPSNTPLNADIYITGEFNSWDPGDENYKLEHINDTLYYIDLPRGVGELEYKFTRGDWTTVEKDNCGYERENRMLTYASDKQLVIDTIYSWADLDPVDCDRITLVINSLPENTPRNAILQLAGNITNWDITDDEFTFEMDENLTKPVLVIYRPPNYEDLLYKITRGSLARSEADGLGREIPPRSIRFGEADTVFIEIRSWADLEQSKGDMITLLVDRIPDNTPAGDPIFFVGEINNWYPHDENLRLEENKNGQYFIRLPKRAYEKEYKFTRGSWNSVEKDSYGYEISNRVLKREKSSDTVVVSIWNWADLSVPLGGELTIFIVKVPDNTPKGAELYVAGNFNSWVPGDEAWKMNSNDYGIYFISIPRQGDMLEYKFTRGSWESVEVDASGDDIPNRTYKWRDIDAIEVSIAKWKDLQ